MDRLAKIGRFIFRCAQKTLLTSGLFCAYMFGIGPMAALSRLSAIFIRESGTGKDTFWEPARGYSADLKDAREQS